jgi:hypothetical protein
LSSERYFGDRSGQLDSSMGTKEDTEEQLPDRRSARDSTEGQETDRLKLLFTACAARISREVVLSQERVMGGRGGDGAAQVDSSTGPKEDTDEQLPERRSTRDSVEEQEIDRLKLIIAACSARVSHEWVMTRYLERRLFEPLLGLLVLHTKKSPIFGFAH